jgi:hypothetical protein
MQATRYVPPDRAEAERRVQQIGAFRAELAALKAAGVSPLTTAQEAALSSYHDDVLQRLAAEYDIDRSEQSAQLSRGMRLLSFFGAVALIAAVYSLVERFWGRLDLPQQLTLLTSFPLIALGGVEWSARRERTLYVASLFALVAYGTFWLAIITLTFGAALAIPYRLRVLLAAALVALPIGAAAVVFQRTGVPWSIAFERLDVITFASFCMLAFAGPLGRIDRAFRPVVRLVSFVMGFGGLLVLSTSAGTSLAPLNSRVIEAVYQGLMLVTALSTLTIAIRRQWNESVIAIGVFFALFLLTRFVDWFWDVLPRYVFFLVLAAFSFVALFVLRRLRGRVVAAA